MKTLLLLTSVLLASTSTSTCNPRTSQGKAARECVVSAAGAPVGAVTSTGVATPAKVNATRATPAERPALPAHLFM